MNLEGRSISGSFTSQKEFSSQYKEETYNKSQTSQEFHRIIQNPSHIYSSYIQGLSTAAGSHSQKAVASTNHLGAETTASLLGSGRPRPTLTGHIVYLPHPDDQLAMDIEVAKKSLGLII